MTPPTYRSPNETIAITDTLSALAHVLTPQTRFASGAFIGINDDAALQSGQGPWPALVLIESKPQRRRQIARYTWQVEFTALAGLIDACDQQPSSYDAAWQALDHDAALMIANLEDNTTLLVNGTRYALTCESIEPTPFDAQAFDSSTYGRPTVQKLLKMRVVLPPYISQS